MMTDEQDRRNAELNDIIRQCRHDHVGKNEHGKIICADCPAEFAVVFQPRNASPPIVDVDLE